MVKAAIHALNKSGKSLSVSTEEDKVESNWIPRHRWRRELKERLAEEEAPPVGNERGGRGRDGKNKSGESGARDHCASTWHVLAWSRAPRTIKQWPATGVA